MKYKTTISVLSILIIIGGITSLLMWQAETKKTAVQTVQTKPQPASSSHTSVTPETKPETLSAIQPFRLRFAPEDGETIAFRFESRTDAEIDFGFITPAISGVDAGNLPEKGEKTPVAMHATGDLYLKYFALEPGRWQVAALIDNLSYRINGEPPIYEAAVKYPFTFKMISNGFLDDFEFVKGISKEAEQFVKQILLTMQTAFPKEEKPEWSTREIDMTGRYKSAYSLVKTDEKTAGIVKQKTEYIDLKAAQSAINESVSASKISIQDSRTDITIPRKGAWILTATQKESTVTKSGDYAWAESAGTFSANRIEKDVSDKFPNTFDGFLADMKSGKYIKSKYYATDALFDRLGANINMEDAIGVYDKLKNSGENNAARYAEKFIVNYLRQHPKASFDLIKIMSDDPKRERMDQSTQLIMWRLITEAGHTEAQQAMADAITNPELSGLTQWRAIAYSHSFENPEPFLADTLWNFYQDLAVPADRRERDMKTSSLFAIGSMGSDEKVNPETKEKVSRLLRENLQNTASPGEQIITLGAVGNYGGEEMIETIEPFFKAENEQVRAAAFNALRRMDDPLAVETLARYYETETSPDVKLTAAATLSRMPATSQGINWAGKTILKTDAPKEQEYLARVVGKNLKDYPENEETLREVLKKNPDNSVKQEIYKYIVPK